MITSGMEDWEVFWRRWRWFGGEARIVYCAPERFASNVFLEALSRPEDRPVRRRRGALRLGVGPRLPARLPAADRGRRAAGAPAGAGLTATATPPVREEIAARFGMRDAVLIRPASIGRTSASTSRARGQGRRRGDRRCSSRSARLRHRPGSSTASPARRPKSWRRSCHAARRGHLPRRPERARRDPGALHGAATAASSSPPTRSAWGSTRPTCAGSYT